MFAAKTTKAQTKSATSPTVSAPPRLTLGARPLDRRGAEQAQPPQRIIGNQAMLRLLALGSGSRVGTARDNQYGEADRGAQNIMQGESWEPGGNPLFELDQSSRSQVSYPLPGGIQPKLVIGRSNDPLEHEADQVAHRVIRMDVSDSSGETVKSRVSRKNALGTEELNTPPPEPARLGDAGAREIPASVENALKTPGYPLASSTRAFFEPRFGHDFANVRLHADAAASDSARSIGARAYTSGRDIVFGAGECAPESASGKELLAHELTHVVQQSSHGPQPVQRKEVATDADIKSNKDWTTADRENETPRWGEACKANLNAIDKTQYVRVVERRDFYKWFYHYAAGLGFTTRWALAAYVVANGAHQVADMDDSHSWSNSLFSMANVELEGAMREGNQIIFDNVLPKLKKLIDGGPLKGPAALKWDSQVLAEEQALVQPMYKLLSPDSIKQMEYIAEKKRLAFIGAKGGNAWGRIRGQTGGDYIAGDKYVEGGAIPAFDQNKDLQSVDDRWQYGMSLGDKFTPGGTGFDPARDKMPAAAAGYRDGSELAKVDTRKHLHELDAWLNPNRLDRVGPGSDYKAIIAGLTEAEKMQVMFDRSPDGWAYSIQFAQFGFIDEATVRAALPSDPVYAGMVALFLIRYTAERNRVVQSTPSPMMMGM